MTQPERVYSVLLVSASGNFNAAIGELLPAYFMKINKSSIANRNRIEKFAAAFSGSVDVIFKSGYRDYVSRRCFADIKKELK